MKRLSILTFFLIPVLSWAQDDQKRRSMTYGLGYSHLRMLDRQVSPLLYQSNNIPLYIGFQCDNKNLFNVDFSLNVGAHRPVEFESRSVVRRYPDDEGGIINEQIDVGSFPLIQQEFNISYHFQLPSPVDKLSYYAGLNLKEYFLLSITPTAIFSMNEISVNPSFIARYEIDEQSTVWAKASTPLAGLMVRLPYANDPADGEHGSFISVYTMGTRVFTPRTYLRANLSLGYQKSFSERWNIGFQYDFVWLRYTEKRGITAYNNSLMVKLSKTLKS